MIEWAENIILETSKVVWPSRKDTIAMTIVVCVFVAIASVLLFVIDNVSRELVNLIIQ
ncbi:MAG: preprotein translocase subunit SecE [Bdellovibrionales bacterium RBG_16_40_8]|nr:MAG: preprotein translocase subunit SecE [Bdellovibrionales bacterium RBG_16_40_8]